MDTEREIKSLIRDCVVYLKEEGYSKPRIKDYHRFWCDGIEEYIGVTIMSSKSEEIRISIIENLERGCTIYAGKNGYAPKGVELKEFDIVYTVITRLEMAKLQTELDKVDENAFIIMNTVKDAKGGMIKKRPFKGNQKQKGQHPKKI